MKVLTYYYDIIVLLSGKYTLSLLRIHGIYGNEVMQYLFLHVVQVRQGDKLVLTEHHGINTFLTIPSIFISLLPTNTVLNELTYIPQILYSVINNGESYIWILGGFVSVYYCTRLVEYVQWKPQNQPACKIRSLIWGQWSPAFPFLNWHSLIYCSICLTVINHHLLCHFGC